MHCVFLIQPVLETMEFTQTRPVRAFTSAWEAMMFEYEQRLAAEARVERIVFAEEAEDDVAFTGYEALRYRERLDNTRFDCGWREHDVRTHCSAKSKRTMVRKRGRV